MSFCVDLVSEDSFYENITLGVTKLLEADPRVCNVTAERRMPCDRVAMSTWEQRHSVSLPEDLRHFYSSTDGFLLRWHYKYSGDEILPVGLININPLNELCLSPALKDLLDLSLTRTVSSQRKPTLNHKSKVLELDDCRSIGKVCLVHSEGSWSVWLLSREGLWYWLSDSFTHYLRMALVHLGLPSWQAIFSNTGLIPWAEQLFYVLAPHLLEKCEPEKLNIGADGDSGLNHIDPNIFKNTSRHYARGAAANRPANQ